MRQPSSDLEFRFEVQREFPVTDTDYERRYGPNWDAVRTFCRDVKQVTDEKADRMVKSAISTQKPCVYCQANIIKCVHTSVGAALGREAASQAAGRQQQADAARAAVRNAMRDRPWLGRSEHGLTANGVCLSVASAISTHDLVTEEGPFLPAHLHTLIGPAVAAGLLRRTFGQCHLGRDPA